MPPHSIRFHLGTAFARQLWKILATIITAMAGLVAYVWMQTSGQKVVPTISVNPKVRTSAVNKDADDPAIWMNPGDPAKSVVIGTDKGKDNGGLFVWDLNGRQIQYVPLNHPNNVDVRCGMQVDGELVDIAVVNVCSTREMKVYKFSPSDGTLTDITTNAGIKTPELEHPYGICLYRRPSDGAMFVIQSTQTGENRQLYQYRLEDDGAGKVKGIFLRAFGNNSIRRLLEGLVADDELGYVYAAEAPNAIRMYYADRDRGNDDQITAFATDDNIVGDREGLALYHGPNGTGYLLLSSQGNSTIKVYRREGDGGNPHKHTLVATIKANGCDDTDGLDVTSQPASPNFPQGFLAVHNSHGHQFNLYAWEDIERNLPGSYAGHRGQIAHHTLPADKNSPY